MSALDQHPSVRAFRAENGTSPTVVQAEAHDDLRRLALECGADDAGGHPDCTHTRSGFG